MNLVVSGLVAVVAVGLVFIAGGTLLFWVRERREPMVASLMYHRFASDEGVARRSGRYCISAARFREHLVALQAEGYVTVGGHDVLRMTQVQTWWGRRAIHITIDDGCQSVQDVAVPILAGLGARATLFVTLDPRAEVFVEAGDGQGRMSDETMRALDPAVVEVGAHGVSHRPLRGLSPAEQCAELLGGRQGLESILGRRVDLFSVPGNWFDAECLRRAAECGFVGVWVSEAGANHSGSHPLRLRRIQVDGDLSASALLSRLRPWGLAVARMRSLIRKAPARLLGPRVWLPIRSWVVQRLWGRGGPATLRGWVGLLLGGCVWLMRTL